METTFESEACIHSSLDLRVLFFKANLFPHWKLVLYWKTFRLRNHNFEEIIARVAWSDVPLIFALHIERTLKKVWENKTNERDVVKD